MALKLKICCLLVLGASYSVYSQNTTFTDCASGRNDSPRCQVFNASETYLAALKKKEWSAVSQLGIETRSNSELSQPGANLSLRQFQELLDPLEIQTFSYGVSDVIITNPYEAETRYSLHIRANTRSGNMAIDLPSIERTITWTRVCSNCPETHLRWLVRRDATKKSNLSAALEHAKTFEERMFLLLGSETSALEELIKTKEESGISFFQRSEMPQAFLELSHANRIAKYLNDAQALSAQIDAEVAEERIKGFPNKSDQRLRSFFEKAGEAYATLKQFDKALNYFAQSLKLSDAKDAETLAETYKEIANVHVARGDRTQAISWFRKSYDLLIPEASNSDPDSAEADDLTDALVSLVVLYELEGKDTAAADLIRDASSRVKNDEFRAFLFFFYGLNKWMRGDISNSVNYSEQAVTLFKKSIGDSQEKTEALFSMAFTLSMIYSGRGDYKQAARNLRIAREHLVSTDDEDEGIPEDLIKMIEDIFYNAQGVDTLGLARMEGFYTQIFKNVAGEVGVPDLLDLKGVDYLQRGEKEKALQCWLKGVEFATEIDDRTLLARLHSHIAGYYRSKNDYARSLEHYDASLNFIDKNVPLQALFVNQTQITTDLLGIGQIQSDQEHYDAAIATYQKILTSNRMVSLFSSDVYRDMAEAYYAEHKYEEALTQLNKGIDISLSSGNRSYLWELYQLAGRIHWARAEYALAQASEIKAIKEIERIRKNIVGGELVLESFFEDKISPYHDMVSLLIGQKDFEGALAYAERSKSRVILDALNHGRQYARKFMSPEERDRELSLRTILISLNRQITGENRVQLSTQQLDSLRALRASARLDYEIFRANLYVNHPEIMSAQTPQESGLTTLDYTRPEDDTALLEFVVIEDNSYLFVITTKAEAPHGRPSVQVYDLGIGSNDLADKITNFRLRVSNPEGPVEQLAKDLYGILIKKAEPQLSGKKKLIIVPDGPLWGLPFQALKPSSEHYLVDDKIITYTPSLGALQAMRRLRYQMTAESAKSGTVRAGRSSQASGTLLVIGNPSLLDKSQELPATQTLAEKLQADYGKSHVQILVGPDANKQHVKTSLEQYQIVHIGSHGVLDNASPMYSYLQLAQIDKNIASRSPSREKNIAGMVSENDETLEGWELMDLELKARLVVLSACETARGRVANGEGIVGMSWALFMAGTPATIVTQWRVESDSTNDLMFSFYQNLLIKPRLDLRMDPAEALQRAAITLKENRKYSHPYYWAGFVFVGDGAK
jgi:CHAT domain-containing protein/lipopolysaccharide biosynthesis regulator YciM